MSDIKSTSYSSTGVDYSKIDPLKRFAQEKAAQTSQNLEKFNMKEVSESRGESAFVWDEGDSYRALVVEGLGTKNLVADEMYKLTGKSYYDQIAQDTVAMIINDLIVVGASPQVLNAYFAPGSSDWLMDEERSKDLVEGWAKACNLAGVVWGGGETPVLKGVIMPETIDQAGAAVGIIKPKSRLTLGDKLTAGDSILLVESSGIHANGLTLARAIADKLSEGYMTKLASGKTFGEALLTPTYIYAKLVDQLFAVGIEPHYMANITGHGFRKLMRAKQKFSYVIETLPETAEEFKLIQKESGNSDGEMYGNFNMGAGFAIILPPDQAEKARKIALENGFKSWISGIVEEGEKQVVIKPLNIIFTSETLGVR